MSSSQLDDLYEQQSAEALAKALGISSDELEELDYGDIQTNESDDGVTYNYYLEIQKDSSSKVVLEKVVENVSCDDNGDYITAYIDIEDNQDDDEEYREE